MPSDDYQHELTERIKDSSKWPDFDRLDFLAELNDLADKAWEKGTVEGYLASLLIYHQLAEEILRLFLRSSEFLIQLALFPTEIRFPARERIVFGRVVEALKETVEFANKSEVIKLAQSLNERRVALVHGLTKQSTSRTSGRKQQALRPILTPCARSLRRRETGS